MAKGDKEFTCKQKISFMGSSSHEGYGIKKFIPIYQDLASEGVMKVTMCILNQLLIISYICYWMGSLATWRFKGNENPTSHSTPLRPPMKQKNGVVLCSFFAVFSTQFSLLSSFEMHGGPTHGFVILVKKLWLYFNLG